MQILCGGFSALGWALRANLDPTGPGLAAAGQPARHDERPSTGTQLQRDDRRLSEMRKRPGTAGDLWDAFTCAFTACCEDRGAVEFHGWSDDPTDQRRLLTEGAILTVRRSAHSAR